MKASLSPSIVFFEDGAWDMATAFSGMRRTLDILGQCGIVADKLNVYVVRAPTRLTDFSDSLARELVPRLNISRPAVYFVRDSLQPRKLEYEVIANANSKSRPELRDTLWILAGARDLGEGTARTLMYMLMDRYEINKVAGSLFYSDQTNLDNSRIDEDQCSLALRTGQSNGLLKAN